MPALKFHTAEAMSNPGNVNWQALEYLTRESLSQKLLALYLLMRDQFINEFDFESSEIRQASLAREYSSLRSAKVAGDMVANMRAELDAAKTKFNRATATAPNSTNFSAVNDAQPLTII